MPVRMLQKMFVKKFSFTEATTKPLEKTLQRQKTKTVIKWKMS